MDFDIPNCFEIYADTDGDIRVKYKGVYAFYIFVYDEGTRFVIENNTFTVDNVQDEVTRLCTLIRLSSMD